MDYDYWYDNRDQLKPNMIVLLHDGQSVLLDRRVPGDGTQWYVANRSVRGNWCYEDDTIEPGEIAMVIGTEVM